jgi:hypothetical protein
MIHWHVIRLVNLDRLRSLICDPMNWKMYEVPISEPVHRFDSVSSGVIITTC